MVVTTHLMDWIQLMIFVWMICLLFFSPREASSPHECCFLWVKFATEISESIMNRDERAHCLSHVYDPLLALPTSGDHRSRRLDQTPSFRWSKLPKNVCNCQHKYSFVLVLANELLIYVYYQTWWISSRILWLLLLLLLLILLMSKCS